MRGIVFVNGKKLEIDLNSNTAVIENTRLPIKIEKIPDTIFYILWLENSPHIFAPFEINKGQITLFLNGELKKTEVLKESAEIEKEKTGGIIRSPMTGKVVEIFITGMEKISKGKGILIIEAMKMRNEIKSPFDGEIKEIFVKKGEIVERGSNLVRIE